MPSIEHMRSAISDAYPGEGWKFRCEHMHENQVIAIYGSLMKRGAFDSKPEERKFIPLSKKEWGVIGRASEINSISGPNAKQASEVLKACKDASKNKLDMIEPSGESWVQLSMF